MIDDWNVWNVFLRKCEHFQKLDQWTWSLHLCSLNVFAFVLIFFALLFSEQYVQYSRCLFGMPRMQKAFSSSLIICLFIVGHSRAPESKRWKSVVYHETVLVSFDQQVTWICTKRLRLVFVGWTSVWFACAILFSYALFSNLQSKNEHVCERWGCSSLLACPPSNLIVWWA